MAADRLVSPVPWLPIAVPALVMATAAHCEREQARIAACQARLVRQRLLWPTTSVCPHCGARHPIEFTGSAGYSQCPRLARHGRGGWAIVAIGERMLPREAH